MITPFQKYLLENIRNYDDTPPGFYYDPIRDQSVKGDNPFDFDTPPIDVGPRPEFDFEIADVCQSGKNMLHFVYGGIFWFFAIMLAVMGKQAWERLQLMMNPGLAVATVAASKSKSD